MTNEQVERIARQTGYTAYQIRTYLNRVALLSVADDLAEANIREAAMFQIDLDLLGR